MYPSLTEVKCLPKYKLLLTFENNEKRVFDVKPYMKQGLFKDLRDEKIFKAVKISFDTIEWPNRLDICPEMLYEESKEYSKNK